MATDLTLYRVKATGEIVMARGLGYDTLPSLERRDFLSPDDLTPVVAAEPGQVLPNGVRLVDVSDRVRRDGGPMPLVVLKSSQPGPAGESVISVYTWGLLWLYPDFQVWRDRDNGKDLIPKPRESKYRPFRDWDEAKHLFGQRVRHNGGEWMVYFVNHSGVSLSDGRTLQSMGHSELLSLATMLDGTPCGVREDG